MMTLRRVVGVVLAVLLTIQPCFAWSECGHHIIAILAFGQLKPTEQERVIELLQKHPRYNEDFQTPQNPITEPNHWTIGRAAYWPDVARKQPLYNRPNWHCQVGSSLTIGDVVKVPETPGALPENADLKTQELHIAQAVELCRRTLRSETAPKADKAISICWLAHLVADGHQPCHAGSLYVEGIFPEGDRKANSIPTKQSRNLHALWDGLPGNRYDAGDIDRRVGEIKHNVRRTDENEEAVQSLEPLQWLAESSGFAKSHVYTSDVLDALDAAKRARSPVVEIVDLPETYLKDAGILAVQRAAFAHHNDARDAKSAGFQIHLPKPVNFYELTAVVSRLTGRTG